MKTVRRSAAVLVAAALAGCQAGMQQPSPTPDTAAPTSIATQATSAGPTAAPTAVPSPGGDVLDLPPNTPLAAGRYFIDLPGIPIRVRFRVAGEGWVSWIGTYKREQTEGTRHRYLGVSIANVTNVVRHGCTDPAPADPPIGPTVDDLARALASLAPFEVTSPPAAVARYGYQGTHLELAVPDDMEVQIDGSSSWFPECRDGELKSWIAPPLSYAFWGHPEPAMRDTFWILDVEGSRVVIQANWLPDAPTTDRAEMEAVLDSIEIEIEP